MLDFFALTPEEFEDLCYQYITKLYQKPGYEVTHTRYVHDGGRDIEITFYDELSHFRIWAECKRHKNSIGLDDIGKNVVLVLSRHVNRVIFFSASEITEGAKIEISRIADAFGFDVSFLCSERLSEELQTQPELVGKYFGQDAISAPGQTEESLTVQCSVTEFESDVIFPAAQSHDCIVLREGSLFNIYVHLSNRTGKLVRDIQVQACPASPALLIYESGAACERLLHQSDAVIRFRGEIINKQSAMIELPNIALTYQAGGATRAEVYTLPRLDISKCKHYPLVGKRVTEFLSKEARCALEWCGREYPQVIDLRGLNGSGKSRLAEEIQHMASREGYRTVSLNGTDYIESDLLRKLFCELLHLPFYHGKINFTSGDIRELVCTQGGSESFSHTISYFLEYGRWGSEDLYYLVEAAAHFMLVPYRDKGYCITIDNTQALSPQLLKFLIRLIELLTQNHGRILLILVSNTERIPSFSSKHFQAFLHYLTEKKSGGCGALTTFECAPFSESDAIIFLMHLFRFGSKSDPLLQKLLQWTGRLPFELVMTLEYLSQVKIVEWLDTGVWQICNHEQFAKLLNTALPVGVQLLDQRTETWRQSHTKAETAAFTELLASVTCFEGLLPYAHLYEYSVDQGLLEQMERGLWLAPAGSGLGITFFHDNIRDYCNALPQYRKHPKVLKRILRWLNANLEIEVAHREKIEFFCYYNLGNFEKALRFGLDFLRTAAKSQSYTDIAAVSRTLFEDVRTQRTPADYMFVADVYADAVFSFDNKDLGCEIYAQIVAYIREKRPAADLTEICKLLHRAINSQLQTAHYETSLEWIGMMESLPDLPQDYQFLAENRYGVTYLALGQFDKAKEHFCTSLNLAEHVMGNLYWSSTTHSDLALYYFYHWRAYGRDRAKNLIVDEFRAAISDYERYGKANPSRDIEMAWHRAFIGLLNGESDHGLAAAEDCIRQSRLHNQTYGLSRGNNLKALAQIRLGDLDAAESTLEETLHICEICLFSSGIFRMYNNLGVVAALRGEDRRAKQLFGRALESLGKEQIKIKQQPALSNLLVASIRSGDRELAKRTRHICNTVGSAELFEFQKALSVDAAEQGALDSLSYWGSGGISYLF